MATLSEGPTFARLRAASGTEATNVDPRTIGYASARHRGHLVLAEADLAADKVLALAGRAEARSFIDFDGLAPRFDIDAWPRRACAASKIGRLAWGRPSMGVRPRFAATGRCRDEHGCTSSHNPDGPCWLFESHTIDSDGARVRIFSVHFGADRPTWDETTTEMEYLEGLGRFDDLDAAIGWLRANRPSWRGPRGNGGWF